MDGITEAMTAIYHHFCLRLSDSKEASKGKAIMYSKKIGHGCWLSTMRGGDVWLLGSGGVFKVWYNVMGKRKREREREPVIRMTRAQNLPLYTITMP
jgi:hypothetical protein